MDYSFLEEIKNRHLLIAGECGIDEYIWGETRRISPEAPVPVVEVDSVTFHLGMAGNVAQNIRALGAKATLVSVIGEDSDGERLSAMTKAVGVHHVELIRDDSRPTLRKVRIIAQKQHVVRVDYERSHGLRPEVAKKFHERLCDLLPASDGIILQDYGKGLWISDTLGFIQHAKAHRKPVFVDPSRHAMASQYRGVTLLTPNISEAFSLSRQEASHLKSVGKDDERLKEIAKQILDRAQAEHVIITCGEWGMIVVSSNGEFQRIPTFAREVFDVTGAGDTVISVLGLLYASGLSLPMCMRVSNAAAGLVVGQVGTASVTSQELRGELERLTQLGLLP